MSGLVSFHVLPFVCMLIVNDYIFSNILNPVQGKAYPNNRSYYMFVHSLSVPPDPVHILQETGTVTSLCLHVCRVLTVYTICLDIWADVWYKMTDTQV